ncbi:MAG: CU044_5270 family protein [Actinomycetales bacterium]
MNRKNPPAGIGTVLAAADPARDVYEADLQRSRARSLALMTSDATATVQVRLNREQRSADGSGPELTAIRATRAPRRVLRRTIIASAAAAVLVGAIVAADVIVSGGPAGATAEAAEVLSAAATATIKTSDPAVKPGQYLKVDTTAVYSTSTLNGSGKQLSWLDKTGGQLYVPADRTGTWVWNREPRVPTTFFSDEAKAEALRPANPGSAAPVQLVGVLRAAKGAFYGSPQTVVNGMPLDEAVKNLPRDPKALLDVIYQRTRGSGPSPESEALITIADTLRTGVIPADLRAALYKSAALIPGVTMVERQATLDGRTGVAIGIEIPGGGGRQDIIIDPATGLLIGEREVMLKSTAEFPAGTATSWTAIRTSVVDSAP